MTPPHAAGLTTIVRAPAATSTHPPEGTAMPAHALATDGFFPSARVKRAPNR